MISGFYAQRSHRIVECPGCALQPPLFGAVQGEVLRLAERFGIPPYEEGTGRGQLRHIYLRQGTVSGELMICLITVSADLPGLKPLARELAAAWVCTGDEPVCGRCSGCRKAGLDIHPDIITLDPQGEGLKAEDVRALRSDAYIRPNEGARKVYIIHPADAMNPAAQNALLKVLEEGPSYAAFLLAAARPGLLLDTVRSRCELMALPPGEDGPDPALVEQGAALAALLLEGDELACVQALVELECSKPKAEQLAALLGAAESHVSRRLAQNPRRGAQVLRALKACRENAVYRPNAGLTLGWLAAQLF